MKIFLWLAFLPTLFAKIVEFSSFQDIRSHLTEETLLILDIDDTLLIPKQMLGCDEWFSLRVKKHGLEKALAEWEAVRHLTKMEIVEPGTETIVQTLQSEGIPIMGLTTQGIALATRTRHQLLENSIDLLRTAPSQESHYIEVDRQGALYRGGILFTAGGPKGEFFFCLCSAMGTVPRRIVFVNDKQKHLADLEGEAEKRGVEFIGLRYSYSDARKAAFQPEIAEFQFQNSTLERLLTDQEAITILQSIAEKS